MFNFKSRKSASVVLFSRHNNSSNKHIHKVNGFPLNLSSGASLVDSSMSGSLSIDKFTIVKNSRLDGYNEIGCFSIISCSNVGRYTSFGSRVSIGPFDHPTNWLSISEFQYRDTSRSFGESLTLHSSLPMPSTGYYTNIGSDVWIGDNSFV